MRVFSQTYLRSRTRVSLRRFAKGLILRCWEFSQTFVLPIKIAVPGAVLAAVVKFLDKQEDFLDRFMPDKAVHTALNMAITFMIVFHTSHAYGRFMTGISLMYEMLGELHEVVALLVCFANSSTNASPPEVLHFEHLIGRLFSLLFMSCLARLEEDPLEQEDEFDSVKAHSYGVIDPAGLDPVTLKGLYESRDRPLYVYYRILNLMMAAHTSGVIAAPPPLFTRCFQNMGNAMIKFHEAQKFKDTPFPAPYVTLADLLMVVNWVFTPFMVATWTEGPWGAACWTFVLTAALWGMHAIAEELDNPFNESASEFSAANVLQEFNLQLLNMLDQNRATPDLSAWAHKVLRPFKRKRTANEIGEEIDFVYSFSDAVERHGFRNDVEAENLTAEKGPSRIPTQPVLPSGADGVDLNGATPSSTEPGTFKQDPPAVEAEDLHTSKGPSRIPTQLVLPSGADGLDLDGATLASTEPGLNRNDAIDVPATAVDAGDCGLEVPPSAPLSGISRCKEPTI